MELDDLKNIWQKQTEDKEDLSVNFTKIEKRTAKHPANRFLRKLIIENVLALSFGTLVFIGITGNKGYPGAADYMLLITIIIYLFIAGSKLWQMRKLQQFTVDTLNFTKNLLQIINGYIKINLYLVVFLVPVILLIGYLEVWCVIKEQHVLQILAYHIKHPVFIIIALLFSSILTWFTYLFSKWYYGILYGKELYEVSKLIEELDSNN